MIISTLAVVSFALFITAGADGQDDAGRYLERARAYADTMLEKGRDRWGESTPLFASIMNRKKEDLLRHSMRIQTERNTSVTRVTYAKGKKHHEFGQAAVDRVMESANITDENQLYRLLYELSGTTGRKRYADAADAAFRYFWTNCQDSNTGLMAWGEHVAWHLPHDTWFTGAAQSRNHEPAWFPYFGRCYEMGGEVRAAVERYARGTWRWQVGDHETGRFDRHCHLEDFPDTAGIGGDFPRIVGHFIEVWALVAARTKDEALREELLRAEEVMLTHWLRWRGKSGAIPATSKKDDTTWVNQTLRLMTNTARAERMLPNEIAEKARRLHRSQRNVIVNKMDHSLDPEDGEGYVLEAHVDDLEVVERGTSRGMLALWMLTYADTVDDAAMRELAMKGARMLRARPVPDPGEVPDHAKPAWWASKIRLLLRAHGVTGRTSYLQKARTHADLALELFLDEHSALPKVQRGGRGAARVYESRTGASKLMLALLELHRVMQGESLEPRFLGR